MCLFRFCWTWCMNCSIYVYMLLETWTLCINLMNVVISRLYFVLDCVFFCKLNADYVFYPAVTGWADVDKPVTTVDLSSDGQMMSARPSLLWATVAVGVFGPSLLSYHYSGALVTTGRMPMAIMTYGLLQLMDQTTPPTHRHVSLSIPTATALALPNLRPRSLRCRLWHQGCPSH
jgi:hypothetical protein